MKFLGNIDKISGLILLTINSLVKSTICPQIEMISHIYKLIPNPSDEVSPIPEFKPSVKPQLFILEETPYISVVQAVLQRTNLQRPSSKLTKYQHLFFVQLLPQILAPTALVLSLACNIVRFYQNGPDTDHNSDKGHFFSDNKCYYYCSPKIKMAHISHFV